MPSTLVAMALGALIAAALLDDAFDARAVGVVVAAAAFPDLDVFADLLHEGLHNALLHNVFVPGIAAASVYYDTRVREESWLLDRYGPRGVQVAWTALVAYLFAGIVLDLLNVESAAPLWPLHDRFYSVVGRLEFNNHEVVVQTFLEPNLGGGPLFPGARRGTVAGEYVVASFLNPAPGPDRGVERVLLAVGAGWQLLLVLAAPVVTAARLRLERADPRGREATGTGERGTDDVPGGDA
jgi:membrane-bound metal-dependent hydrolase YbcI (DUF457 family)